MRKFDRITWNPNQMNGQPCIRGLRLTVRRVVEAVATYPDRDDLFRNYPELEPEDVRQALAFAELPIWKTARPKLLPRECNLRTARSARPGTAPRCG
jgi:uncharacterized protein (DUF433 family)